MVRTAVDGRVTVHLPLSWSPPESDTEVGYEIDVVLIPAEPQTRRPPRAFEAGCGAEEQRVAPMAVSRTGFTLTIETVYGERSMMCKDTLPEHCTTKVEQVYTQVKF